MALDIVLTKYGVPPVYNQETSIRFDDEGDYLFLEPFFKKLKKSTSEIIDLYDDCAFEGEDLVYLKKELEEEIIRLSLISEEKWTVYKGMQTFPVKKEIYMAVIKKDVISKLKKWLAITDMAINESERLIGIGD